MTAHRIGYFVGVALRLTAILGTAFFAVRLLILANVALDLYIGQFEEAPEVPACVVS